MIDAIVFSLFAAWIVVTIVRDIRKIRKDGRKAMRFMALLLQALLLVEVHFLFQEAWRFMPETMAFSILMMLCAPRSYGSLHPVWMTALVIALYALTVLAIPALVTRMPFREICSLSVAAALLMDAVLSLADWVRSVGDYAKWTGPRVHTEAEIRRVGMILLLFLCALMPSPRDAPAGLVAAGGLVMTGLFVFLFWHCGSRSLLFKSERFSMAMSFTAPRKLISREDQDEEYLNMIYRKCCKYMETKKPFLVESFSLADLAAGIFTNKSYVSRAINRSSELNFRRFVNRYRVSYAQNVFRQNMSLKVVELAHMAGCKSVQTFCGIFRLFVGENPKTWCDRIRKVKQ